MKGLKNAKNLNFWSFWAKKAKFGRFLAKMAKTVKIIKKALGTFFSHLQAPTNWKVSEKSTVRTNTTPKVSKTSLSRDQKALGTFFLTFGT